ncbi:ATP-dependent DNA ligase [Streptomyces sp. NPDC003007]
MLSTPVPGPYLRPGWAAEPKWDGFRALLSVDASRVVLRSRRGTEMLLEFPEIEAGAAQLPDATALDGELVVWDAAGRLSFEQLQTGFRGAAPGRPRRRATGIACSNSRSSRTRRRLSEQPWSGLHGRSAGRVNRPKTRRRCDLGRRTGNRRSVGCGGACAG